jgi:hypothetical protein
MPRLGLWNLLIGFVALSLAASGGAFIANDMTNAFIQDKAFLDSWQHTLLSSSHGHTNLFGFLHIAFGLTLAYSPLPLFYKKLQTAGLLCGTLAMGPGLILKAFSTPATNLEPLGLVLGLLLSLALATLVSHSGALAYRLLKRA